MEMTLEQAEKEFMLERKHGKIHIKKYIGVGGNVDYVAVEVDEFGRPIYLDENGEPYFTFPRFRISRSQIKTNEEAVKYINYHSESKGREPIIQK